MRSRIYRRSAFTSSSCSECARTRWWSVTSQATPAAPGSSTAIATLISSMSGRGPRLGPRVIHVADLDIFTGDIDKRVGRIRRDRHFVGPAAPDGIAGKVRGLSFSNQHDVLVHDLRSCYWHQARAECRPINVWVHPVAPIDAHRGGPAAQANCHGIPEDLIP